MSIVVSVLTLFDSTRDAGDIITWFFRPCPSYCLTSGILAIAT